MYVGKRIKQLRQSLSLNQTEFADALGVSQSYYSAIELGKKKISKKLAEKIYQKWPNSKEILSNDKGVNIGGYVGGSNVEEWVDNLPHELKVAIFKKQIKQSGNQQSIYSLRFVEDLRKERPDLSNMVYAYSELSAFSHDLEKIYKVYIEPALSPEIKAGEVKNYNEYKEKNIKHLDSFLEYKEALYPVIEILRKLIEKDFPPIDSKGVLQDKEA